MTLVIKRKEGQVVRIGETLLTVQRISRSEVKLGIDAPPGVDIVRGELEATWQREKKEGSGSEVHSEPTTQLPTPSVPSEASGLGLRASGSEGDPRLWEFEWRLLEAMAGRRPALPWGAAVGEALEVLKGKGLVDNVDGVYQVTERGTALLGGDRPKEQNDG